uniref:Uncharacterized protein n=1 Tax=Panagrolaimus sp. JU765 TaxID=591449 RepID=A0AC34QBJ9_9BILA
MNRIKATTPASIFDKLFEPAKPADVMKEIRRAQPIYPPSLPKPAVSFYPDIEKPETWFKKAQELPTLPPLFPLKKKPEPLKLEDIIPSASLNPSAEPTPIQPLKLSDPFTETNALASLLQPLGVNGDQNAEEVQIGRDRTISVLGMPVGRRDGLALSPLRGMSYGNQNMYGPIAVNDKYNLQWDFLNKIGSMFDPNHDQSFLKNVMTIFGQN